MSIKCAGRTLSRWLVKSIAVQVNILVHPSFVETFGIATADAVALGRPVIGDLKSNVAPWLLGKKRSRRLRETATNEYKVSKIAFPESKKRSVYSIRTILLTYKLFQPRLVNAN